MKQQYFLPWFTLTSKT